MDSGPAPATGNADSRRKIGALAKGLGGGNEGGVEKVSHLGALGLAFSVWF